MTYSIETLSESNVHQWEEFNRRSREGTLFHSAGWKNILEDVLNVKTRYYLIVEGRRVVGLCPGVEQSAGVFRGLTSIPHSEFNNLVLDDSFDIGRFDEALSHFAKRYSFLHFNTYNPAVLDGTHREAFGIEETGNMVLNVRQKSPDEVWSSFSRNMRYNIQIFENRGFKIREVHQRSEIRRFYRYYVENLTHIRGDILPFSFFERLHEVFPDRVKVAVLTNDDVFAGGWLTLLSPEKKAAYYQYLALNRSLSNQYTPTYPIYWDLVNRAWDNGYETLSFGRQKFDPGSPRYLIKAKFGAEYVPIHSKLVPLSKAASLAYLARRKISGARASVTAG